ncbi:MAG: glycine-rich protein [Candidatus Zixiibacteriota bacterium]
MKRFSLFVLAFLAFYNLFSVEIGSDGEDVLIRSIRTGINVESPDVPNAVFEVKSNESGILIPRLTIIERDAIASPATGLMIYNTDCSRFNYYDGTHWLPFPNLTSLNVGPISGSTSVCSGDGGLTYSIVEIDSATSYEWSVPSDATIISGAGTESITLDFGIEDGRVCVMAHTPCGSEGDCINIEITDASVGGIVSGGGSIELGETTDDLLLSGHTGDILRWQKRLDSGSWTNISFTGTTYNEIPSSTGTWDYRAIVQSGTCPEDSSDYATVEVTSASPDSIIFTYTGSEQTWTVPSGVSSINIECYGAQGGNYPSYSGYGGEGGTSTGTLSVTPGELLYIYVGEQGENGGSGTPAGGFNGGGYGYYQPGGGGASDVRHGGNTYADRVIVAGGGGGCYSGHVGGAGGGTEGEDATWTNNDNLPYSGTQTEGGRWGSGFGYGGTGGSSYNAGGGGGGYYGGGSGEDIVTNVTGAGGSGYIGGVTSGTTSVGGNTGNGMIKLSW